MIISYVLIKIVYENISGYFSIDNLRPIKPKVCTVFFFHSINLGILWEHLVCILYYLSLKPAIILQWTVQTICLVKGYGGKKRRKVDFGVEEINDSLVLHTSSGKLFILGTRLIFIFTFDISQLLKWYDRLREPHYTFYIISATFQFPLNRERYFQ